jgi:aryl-alcohol dehydrogenase
MVRAKAAVMQDGGAMLIQDIDLADPKKEEILVKIMVTGVCHTDEAVRGGIARSPAVLGHEGSGIVEKAGPGVTEFKPGDHVVLTYASCGACDSCVHGQPYACDRTFEMNMGGKMPDGTSRISQGGKEIGQYFGQSSFAEYAVVNVQSAVKVDDDVDISILGPLGCGFQTGAGTVLEYLKAKPTDSIVVFGIGSVGFAAIMGAKIAGCKNIIAVGGTPDKLKLALELGATHIINRKEIPDIGAEIVKITGRGAQYIIDTTGQNELIQEALKGLATLGTLILLAMGPPITIDPVPLMGRSQTISAVTEGCVKPKEFIPRLVKYYKEGRFPFDKLLKFYSLDEIEKAFQDMHNGAAIKPALKMSL